MGGLVVKYLEVLESYEQQKLQSAQAKQKNAREKIASANSKRSDAASRYQDRLKACSNAIETARASLTEGAARMPVLSLP